MSLAYGVSMSKADFNYNVRWQVVENWTFSLFFCVAELWGAVVISVLFWTLANEVCTVGEAKTIYPLMGIAANVALVAAGNFMKAVNLALPVRALTHEGDYVTQDLRWHPAKWHPAQRMHWNFQALQTETP